MTPDELQKLDYEKTLDFVHTLTDVRFKLLALVPIATGAALGLTSSNENPMGGLVLGALGFFVTLGILFYDLRNTQIYEKEMHRARLLELSLQIPPIGTDVAAGGPIGGRPKDGRRTLFQKYEIWHDRGLAFVYSTVLAVWSYLFLASCITLLDAIIDIPTLKVIAVLRVLLLILIPLGIAVTFWKELHRLDNETGDEITQMKDMIRSKQKEAG